MKTLLRYLDDNRFLWRVWVPLLAIAAISPLFVLGVPLVEKQLIDNVILPKRPALLPGIAVLFAALWLLATASNVVASALKAYLSERLSLRFRQRLFAHSGELSLDFARRANSGQTLSHFFNDVPAVTSLFASAVADNLTAIVGLTVGVVIMFSLSAQLAVAGVIGTVLAAAGAAVVTRPLRPAARRFQDKAAEVTQRVQEHLAGMREVIAFGQIENQEIKFTSTLWQLLQLRVRLIMIDTAVSSGYGLLSLAVTLSIVIYGSYLVIRGTTTLGTIVAMRGIFDLLFQPAGQLIGMFSTTQKALGAGERIYEFLDAPPSVEEIPGARSVPEVVGEVRFENVSFAYEPGRRALSNLSFIARPGETVALVGPSGAGKTTLTSLIARFYDPDEGSVLLDGSDLRTLSLTDLRDQIAFVFQDNFLFDATIAENIRFGYDDATEEEIIAAAHAANAWEFIERLPAGLTTKVGERGVRLSEGQRQRIAIARALVREPPLLILDEPTSALDAHAEHLLESALSNLMRERTTFVIAHRLTTVRRADRILVMDAGSIVEEGSHGELMHRGGLYRDLYDLQFRDSDGPKVSTPPADVA